VFFLFWRNFALLQQQKNPLPIVERGFFVGKNEQKSPYFEEKRAEVAIIRH
jgi:hypothetical protein